MRFPRLLNDDTSSLSPTLIKNDLSQGVVFYGLHMCEGVAEYQDKETNGGQPYRILIMENAVKQMDATFAGCPVFVRHVNEVPSDVRAKADGWVTESFFNKADGRHWCKFVIVSEAGLDAIVNKKWKLSNAYRPKLMNGGGRWHNVDYAREVMAGEYEHLAIVPNPRYEESIILTPEEFKSYNSQKEAELLRLANSKETPSMLNLFKRTKVENASDLETTVVELPKSKQQLSIVELVNAHEETQDKLKAAEEKIANMAQLMASMDAKVKVGDKEMSVGELCNAYNDLMAKNAAAPVEKKEGEDADKKENGDDEEKKKKDEEAAKQNAKDAEDAAAKAKEAAAKQKDADLKHFESLKNAVAQSKANPVVELTSTQVARGKSRYGSGN